MLGGGMMGMVIAFIAGMGLMYVGKDKIAGMLSGGGAAASRARARRARMLRYRY